MNALICLKDIAVGERALICELNNPPALRRRLRDMGMIEGTTLECIGKSPSGDPSSYLVRGTVIAIRAIDAAEITAMRTPNKEPTPWD